MQFNYLFRCLLIFPFLFHLLVNVFFVKTEQEIPWKAPAWADTLSNPLSTTSYYLMNGKILYQRHCVICHGENGRGDGESGFGLEKPPGDFMSADIIGLSDGALFWKISNGKGAMPEFASKLNKEKRWELLVYLRHMQQQFLEKKKKKQQKSLTKINN